MDNAVPLAVAEDIGVPVIDLSAMVLEGGAIEVMDRTLMATRSSITGEDRNPDLTESEIEAYLSTYLGVEQIIWLDGQFGGMKTSRISTSTVLSNSWVTTPCDDE